MQKPTWKSTNLTQRDNFYDMRLSLMTKHLDSNKQARSQGTCLVCLSLFSFFFHTQNSQNKKKLARPSASPRQFYYPGYGPDKNNLFLHTYLLLSATQTEHPVLTDTGSKWSLMRHFLLATWQGAKSMQTSPFEMTALVARSTGWLVIECSIRIDSNDSLLCWVGSVECYWKQIEKTKRRLD